MHLQVITISDDPARPLRIVYVVAYRDRDYIRTKSISDALADMPVEVTEIHNTKGGPIRYPEVLQRLRWQLRTEQPDVILLGFRGHEFFGAVRKLAGTIPILFDAFLSPSEVLISERKAGAVGALIGRLIRPIEGTILRTADAVLVDTPLHATLLADTFRIDRGLFAIPIGADRSSVEPTPSKSGPLRILFYGSFLPLHGVEVILSAIRQLEDVDLDVTVAGGGRKGAAIVRSLGTDAVRHHHWIPFAELRDHYLPQTHLLLGGPFGSTGQSQRVVTGKTVQGLASSVPTVVGRTANDYGLKHRENCLLVNRGDAERLASALRWAAENRSVLGDIGRAGHLVYQEHFSSRAIAAGLEQALAYIANEGSLSRR